MKNFKKTEFSRLLDEAFTLLGKGDYEKSLPLIENAKVLFPKNYLIDLALAIYYEVKGDFDKAILCSQTVLGKKPQFGASYFNIGCCLSSMGKKQEALDYYENALSHNYKCNHVYQAILSIKLEKNYTPDIYEFIKVAIKKFPNDGTFNFVNAGLIIKHGDELGIPLSAKVLQYIDKAEKDGFDQSILNGLKGEYYFAIEEWAKASTFLAKSLRVVYENGLAYLFAESSLRAGNNLPKEAASYLNENRKKIVKSINACKDYFKE
jgi:tetratricopeptide (TPR) repeat protein